MVELQPSKLVMPVRSRSPAPVQSHISHPMGELRATREPLPSERETARLNFGYRQNVAGRSSFGAIKKLPSGRVRCLVRHRRGTAHSRPYVSKQSSGRRVAQGRVEPPAIGQPGRTDEAAPHCASSSKRFGGRRKSTSPFGRELYAGLLKNWIYAEVKRPTRPSLLLGDTPVMQITEDEIEQWYLAEPSWLARERAAYAQVTMRVSSWSV